MIILPSLDVSRHKELFNPYYFDLPVTIIGAGALGSWLALALTKLGIKDITVWDFDTVEEHNIPNQAFNKHDVGYPKAEVIGEIINANTGQEINVKNQQFDNQRLAGIVFLMVDSMETRWHIWEKSIKMKSAVKLLVEARMGFDIGRIYNVEPMNLDHIKQYEDTFSYSDEEAEVSACGNSMTVVSTALGITSWCARQLINWHNEDVELDNEILIDFKNNNLITTRW